MSQTGGKSSGHTTLLPAPVRETFFVADFPSPGARPRRLDICVGFALVHYPDGEVKNFPLIEDRDGRIILAEDVIKAPSVFSSMFIDLWFRHAKSWWWSVTVRQPRRLFREPVVVNLDFIPAPGTDFAPLWKPEEK